MLATNPDLTESTPAPPPSRGWPVVLGVGSMVGVIVVAIVLSLATLIFSGPLLANLNLGSVLFLLGAVVMNLIAARWGSLQGAVALPQDASTAVVAVTIAAFLPRVAETDRLSTVVVYILVSTAIAGAVMLALGSFRLGNLVRFIPYPVIGGFLAGTGWLLVVETIDLVTGGFQWTRPRTASLASAIAFAVILVVLLRRGTKAVVFPIMILGGVGLFYAVLAVSGISLSEARSHGLLPPPAPGRSISLQGMGGIDWRAILSGWTGLLTVPLVGTLAMLLNLTALELMAEVDADLNRELRTMGAANLLSSFTGSPAGYQALGPSALAIRLGAANRGVPVVVAALCLLAIAGGSRLVGLLPTPLVGGVLLLVGLGFMSDWLIFARRQVTWAEYGLMVAIVVAVATLGVLAGVLLGMVAAVALFAAVYSRIDPIRHVATGAERRSTRDRATSHAQLLAEHGKTVLVAELQGYLFFGTARTIVDRLRALLLETERCECLILDLRRVNGIDSTSFVSFTKLSRLTRELGCRLIVSSASEHIRHSFEGAGLTDGPLDLASDLDHALEMAEDIVLRRAGPGEAPIIDLLGERLWEKLSPHLTRTALPAGAVIVDYGDRSAGLFFIEDGRVTAEIPAEDGWIRVRSSGPGTVLGEMSVYRGAGRTARLRTEEPSIVHSLDLASISALDQTDPSAAIELHRRLAEVLAGRLAISNDTVRSLIG